MVCLPISYKDASVARPIWRNSRSEPQPGKLNTASLSSVTFAGSRSTGTVLLSSTPSSARMVCVGSLLLGRGFFMKWITCARSGGLVMVVLGGGSLGLPAGLQNLAHADRHVAEVDVDRARRHALVTDGAVIGDVVHLVEVADGDAAPWLLLVQEGLDHETRREDFITRRVKQVRARDMRVADRLALAAAQTVADIVVERAELALFEQQRLLLHEAQ